MLTNQNHARGNPEALPREFSNSTQRMQIVIANTPSHTTTLLDTVDAGACRASMALKLSLVGCKHMLSHMAPDLSQRSERDWKREGGGSETFSVEKPRVQQHHKRARGRQAGSQESVSESRAAGQTSLPAPAGLEELDGTLQLPQQPGGVGTPGGLLELWAPRRGLLVLCKLHGEQLGV